MSTTSNRRLKVAYVITKSNFGGAQRYVFDMARSLPKDRFEPIVVFGGEGLLKEKLERVGIRTIGIPSLSRDVGGNDIRSFFRLISILRKERPDIVHLNSSKIGALGGLAARICRIPRIVFTVHGWAFKEPRPILEKAAIALVSWLTVIFCHAAITVSKDDLDRASWMPFTRKKLVYIPNGIALPKFLSPKVAREKLVPTLPSHFEDALWVGTIAELTRNKGLSTALDAFARLASKKSARPLLLVIIGDGELFNELSTRSASLGLADRVFFVGFKENGVEYLKAFDIFILPSLKEGLPYTLLEAGRASLPVVASHVGGIPEIIADMHSGILVAPGKSDELAKAIQFLSDNRPYRTKFKNALQESVKQKYSLETTVEKTVSLYLGLHATIGS